MNCCFCFLHGLGGSGSAAWGAPCCKDDFEQSDLKALVTPQGLS